MDKLISIILPVYNVGLYLEKCLDSVLNQTYENIEIIAVNDGSTDNSGDILRLYASKDKRIKQINKENKGLSDSRNVGMDHASGDYIMFVDSDDWIDYKCCEILYKSIVENNAQIALFPYKREYGNVSKVRYLFPQDIILNKYDCENLYRKLIGPVDSELSDPSMLDSYSTAWGKLYDRKIIDESKARFVDLKDIGTAEDVLFNIQVFKYLRKAVYCESCFYYYRKGTGMTSNYKNNLPQREKYLFEKISESIDINNPVYKTALNNRIALSVTGLGLNILYNKNVLKSQVEELKEFINSEPYSLAVYNLKTSEMPLHWKFYFSSIKNKQFLCC